MSFIGIDLGTSFIKGAVLNTHSLRPSKSFACRFPSRSVDCRPDSASTIPSRS